MNSSEITPVSIWCPLVLSSIDQLLITLDSLSHFVEKYLLESVPILQYIKNLIDFRPEVWIGCQ